MVMIDEMVGSLLSDNYQGGALATPVHKSGCSLLAYPYRVPA
jgi:hypothetical protein